MGIAVGYLWDKMYNWACCGDVSGGEDALDEAEVMLDVAGDVVLEVSAMSG